MLEAFKNVRFTKSTKKIIEQANTIVASYEDDEIRLTLRQLYYRFIALDLFPATKERKNPATGAIEQVGDWVDDVYNADHKLASGTKNTLKNYKRLGGILSDARLAGLLDWRVIEDRGRVPDVPYFQRDVGDFVDSLRRAANAFSLDKWAGQPNYVELWVEKDALASVLEPIARKHAIPLVVNKGYSSQSAMYESADRFKAASDDAPDRKNVLLYLGDHDPSGEDMVRDITDRMAMFNAVVTVRKIGLTWEQIERLRPPPNPVKPKDARAAAYIARHGRNCWEVDAIEPRLLRSTIEGVMRGLVDRAALNRVLEQEAADRARIEEALSSIGDA